MNDVEIVEDDHYKVSVKESEHLYRLDIDNVGEDHCGKIKVVAKNENGEDSKEVSVQQSQMSFLYHIVLKFNVLQILRIDMKFAIKKLQFSVNVI